MHSKLLYGYNTTFCLDSFLLLFVVVCLAMHRNSRETVTMRIRFFIFRSRLYAILFIDDE